MKRLLMALTSWTVIFASFYSAAHHSAVVFDLTEPVIKSGTVTEFIMRNPHMILTMDVVNGEGVTEEWGVEGQGIAGMQAMGFNRTSVEVGDEITVKMYPMKSGRPGGLIEGMIGADNTAYNMEPSPSEPARQVYPALMEWIPAPEGETWQDREEKTRPSQLPIVSNGLGAGDSSATGAVPGALDPENLAMDRPPAAFDLTGVWQFRGEEEWRPNYGSFEFKPKPTLTATAQAFMDEYIAASARGERFGDPTALCYPPGMPRFMTRYGSLMMLQYPTAIYMMSRLNNDYRVIFLDGRERMQESQIDRNWHGESLGHWEGDTLVVETVGFIGENHLIQAGVRASQQLKIVERYQMINDGNTLAIEFTFTDPENWEGEWKHVKFRDRVLRSDVREANCIYTDNFSLPGID
jgi:hypothetical protein